MMCCSDGEVGLAIEARWLRGSIDAANVRQTRLTWALNDEWIPTRQCVAADAMQTQCWPASAAGSDCGGSGNNERWAKVRVNAGNVETADCASTSAARVTAIAPAAAAAASRRQYLQRCLLVARITDWFTLTFYALSHRFKQAVSWLWGGNNSRQEENRLMRQFAYAVTGYVGVRVTVRLRISFWPAKTRETIFVFYRAACNADAVLWWEFFLSVCLSVRLSVRLSHACIVTKR